MHAAKIAISIDSHLLNKIDAYVEHKTFKNRSQAIQLAVVQAIDRLEHKRLAMECVKLNPKVEVEIAENWLEGEFDLWQDY